MATTFTFTTTDEQDAAIAFVTGPQPPATGAPQDPQTYILSRIQSQLDQDVRAYKLSLAPVTADVAVEAFLNATPQQQAAALQALGLPTTKPA